MKNQKIYIGTVTPDERDVIKSLFERKNALKELFKVLPDIEKKEADILYDKIVRDLGDITTRYNDWWAKTSIKYKWENSLGKQWEIDFDSCEIFIQNVNTTDSTISKN